MNRKSDAGSKGVILSYIRIRKASVQVGRRRKENEQIFVHIPQSSVSL